MIVCFAICLRFANHSFLRKLRVTREEDQIILELASGLHKVAKDLEQELEAAETDCFDVNSKKGLSLWCSQQVNLTNSTHGVGIECKS